MNVISVTVLCAVNDLFHVLLVRLFEHLVISITLPPRVGWDFSTSVKIVYLTFIRLYISAERLAIWVG